MLDDLSHWPSSAVGFSSYLPHWLDALFKEEFFDPCLIHPGVKQFEKNIFCLDCCKSFCTKCSSNHFGHRVLQIRKYNDHRVVKAEDMEKLINCSLVQSYMLNRAQVVFLKARASSGKKEKSQNQAQLNKKRGKAVKQNDLNCDKTCSSCSHSLKDDYDYCSITCMVKQVLSVEGSILGCLQEFLPLPSNPEEAGVQLVPTELILREPAGAGSKMNGSKRVDCLKRQKKNNEESSAGSFVNLRRRKGIPMRSPLY